MNKCVKKIVRFSNVAPKAGLKTSFRLTAILSSYAVKLAAQRDSELKVSNQIWIQMHCMTPATLALKFSS